MKNNGIVSKRTNKRDAGSFLLFVFLLPYVCACLWGHVGEEADRLKENDTEEKYLVEASVEWGTWELPLEEYLAYRLCLVLPEDCEAETRKAQAVLLRTELAALYAEQRETRVTVDGDGLAQFYTNAAVSEEILKKSRQAVKGTDGEILTYRGDPIRASYFRVSNGSTRDAGDEDCPYLSAVPCAQDQEAPDYHSVVRVERERYIEKLQGILEGDFEEQALWEEGKFSFDGTGYMTGVSYMGKDGKVERIDGETFRHLFGLSSASFELDREEDQAVFRVKGVGHGFGMSQYAAERRAKNGENYREILASFFFQTELANFE
ncbi:MAG: SpoIID/LytB domain-containing protein [Lachnospiraceae bacterium]|nr:SpoIID/LytB domain-containing protein [Lachnospiraceae bacterium]